MTTHTAMPNHKVHEGRNIKRFREMLGIKQDALAFDLNMSQQAVSLLEQKETIDTPLLQQISALLKIPVEAIQNFDEEQALNIITNTFNDNSCSNGNVNYNSTFNINPIEKWVEALEEIKKLNEDKITLYERMLKEKDEIMAKLEKLMEKRE
jgi:transcriptional regulator with XRE-family HTH domain